MVQAWSSLIGPTMHRDVQERLSLCAESEFVPKEKDQVAIRSRSGNPPTRAKNPPKQHEIKRKTGR